MPRDHHTFTLLKETERDLAKFGRGKVKSRPLLSLVSQDFGSLCRRDANACRDPT